MKIPEILKKAYLKVFPDYAEKPQTKTGPVNIYRHCTEMPLDAFIDAMVNDNHYRVVKWGKVNQQEVEEAWRNLFAEYCDMSDTKQYKQLFSLSREIGVLHSRLLKVRVCLKVLSIQYSPYAEQSLREMGYICNLNPKDKTSYDKILAAIDMKSRTMEVALLQKRELYDKAVGEYGGKDITEGDFTRNLVELGKYMGFRINPREITVCEYLEIRKKYEAEAEAMEKLNTKK